MGRLDDGREHFSELKAIASSPAHYQHIKRTPRNDTPGMRLGRAVHALVLQEIEPVVYTDSKTRTGKAWEAFCEGRDDVEDILLPSEADTARWMRDAVMRHAGARAILERCKEREVAMEWEALGIQCAGRLDFRGNGALGDLKTCRYAHPKAFFRDAARMHYDAQLPWYDVGGGVVPCGPDTQWSEQFIIAVESSAPYVVQDIRLDPLRIDQGWSKVEEWVAVLKDCKARDEWPGYSRECAVWDGDIDLLATEETEEEPEEDVEA